MKFLPHGRPCLYKLLICYAGTPLTKEKKGVRKECQEKSSLSSAGIMLHKNLEPMIRNRLLKGVEPRDSSSLFSCGGSTLSSFFFGLYSCKP